MKAVQTNSGAVGLGDGGVKEGWGIEKKAGRKGGPSKGNGKGTTGLRFADGCTDDDNRGSSRLWIPGSCADECVPLLMVSRLQG